MSETHPAKNGNNLSFASTAPEYEAVFDESSENYYFWNTITGESTWNLPPGATVSYQSTYSAENDASFNNDELPQQLSSTDVNGPPMQHDAGEWRSEGRIDVNWIGDASPSSNKKSPLRGLDPQPPLTQYSPLNVKRTLLDEDAHIVASSSRMHGMDSLAFPSDSDEDALMLSKNQHPRRGAGPGDDRVVVREILETEEARQQRKFRNMRKNGAVKLNEIDGWVQWRSAHGAVFFSRVGDTGGQWSCPVPFPTPEDDEEDLLAARKAKKLISGLKLDYEKVTSDHHEYSNSFQHDNVLSPMSIPYVDRSFKTRSRAPPQHPLRDARAIGATHNDPSDDKPAVDIATNRLKDIYKSLRSRDRALDAAVELSEVKRKADDAKNAWEQYLTSKSMGDHNRDLFGMSQDDRNLGGRGHDRDSDEEGPITDFDALYARSVVVRQQWPWTVLVDVETDKTFYRNEVEDYFQNETPADLIDDTFLSQTRDSRQLDAPPHSISAVEQQDLKVPINDRYKQELEQRKNHLKNKLSGLLKTERAAESKTGSAMSPSKQPSAIAAAIMRNIDKELGSEAPRPLAKAIYASPKHSFARRNSAFNLSMTQFVKRYNPAGVSPSSDDEDSDDSVHEMISRVNGISKAHKLANFVVDNSTPIDPSLLPYIRKNDTTADVAWSDAQTLLKRLRWFSAAYELQKQANSRIKKPIPNTVRAKESATVQGKYVKYRERIVSDVEKLSLSGMKLSREVEDEVARLALIKAKRIGKTVSLAELNASTDIRRKLAFEAKSYIDKVKTSLDRISSYMYEDDEALVTIMESEIYRRHTLEAAVLLRAALVRPHSVRDLQAYHLVAKHIVCPSSCLSFDLSLPRMQRSELPSRQWDMFTDATGNVIYSEKSTCQMQLGEPFDIECRRLAKSLKYERWFDFGKKNLSSEGGALPPEIMSDVNGGLVFYCPFRRIYHWREKIHVSYYDLPPDLQSQKRAPTSQSESLARPVSTKTLPKVSSSIHSSKNSMSPLKRTNTKGSASALASILSLTSKSSTAGAPTIPETSDPSSSAPSPAPTAALTPLTAPTVTAQGQPRGRRQSLLPRSLLENRQANVWKSVDVAKTLGRGSEPVDAHTNPGPIGLASASISETSERSSSSPSVSHTPFGAAKAPNEYENTAETPEVARRMVDSFIASAIDSSRKIPQLMSSSLPAYPTEFANRGRLELAKDDALGMPRADHTDDMWGNIQRPSTGGSVVRSRVEELDMLAPSAEPLQHLMRNLSSNANSTTALVLNTMTGSLGDGNSSSLFDHAGVIDTSPLRFEMELSSEHYSEYSGHIDKIQASPNDIRLILDLAEFFLAIFLHKESLVCLTRVLDLCMIKPLPVQEFAMITLMLAKLSARCLGEYRLLAVLKDTVASCPDHPPVLCQAARLYELIQADEAAEQLYIGALILDPDYNPALEGYASMLIRQGNTTLAMRYMGRIDERYPGYCTSRIKTGWAHELTGLEPEAVLLAYHSIVTLNKRNRPTVLAVSALGHYHHVRGDLEKALEYYKRGLLYDQNDTSNLILSACATASSLWPGSYQTDASRSSIAIADARFRRGIFLCQHKSHKWIGLLAYADFLSSCKMDSKRIEEVLWEATRCSCQYAIWPSVSLVHFYQYLRGDLARARRVIVWVSNRRRRVMTQIYMRELNGSTNRKDTEDQKNLPQDGAENFERDLDESLAFQIVEAFYFIDVANFDSAIHNCNRVLELDDANVPALRCLATAHWLKGARDEALDVFERALSLDGGKNPYLLRSFSVSSGLSGDHDRALALMTAATEVSPLNPLAWRARGIMSYLYSGDRDSCLDFLSKAYELSGGIDMEAMRFKGQVLMEHGRFSEALSTLRLALHVAPGDPMTLASMATCIAAIQDKDMASVRFPPNYVLKLQLMDDLTLFEFCEDPEELFEAAIFPNLVATVSENQARKFTNYVRSDGASMKGGWGSIKAMQKAGQKQQSDVSNSVDAPPDILFRYGLYCLHRGIQLHSKEYTSKAKNLFMRSSRRADFPPHPLALHMLGWMAELEGDLRTAERYYSLALQVEPIEAHVLLQLAAVIHNTFDYVKSLASSMLDEHRGAQRRRAKPDTVLLRRSGGRTTAPPLALQTDVYASAADMHDDAHRGNVDASKVHQRMILHDRVVWLLELKMAQMQASIEGMQPPGKFVYFETYWLESLVHAFASCDDWTSLLRSSKTFRGGPIGSKSSHK